MRRPSQGKKVLTGCAVERKCPRGFGRTRMAVIPTVVLKSKLPRYSQHRGTWEDKVGCGRVGLNGHLVDVCVNYAGMAWECLPPEDRKGFSVLPCRRLVIHAFGWLMPPRRLARGILVTASMIIATVMNLLHFLGKNQQV